jgi:hypothetical protein
MGRGRAKAKQTKVARELKYSSPETDYERLQRELAAGGGPSVSTHVDEAVGDEDDEGYDDWTSSAAR